MISAEAKVFVENEQFGTGIFLGKDSAVEQFAPEDRLYISARRHACPQPDATIKYYGAEWLKYWKSLETNKGMIDPSDEEVRANGIAITRRRYDECDLVTGMVVAGIKDWGSSKASLLTILTTPSIRLESEPVGYFEEGSVPESHNNELSPLSKLVGYALSRVLIEQFGWGDTERSFGDGARSWERYEKGLDILDEAIERSESPVQLLAILAEMVCQADALPEKVLGHILTQGVLIEENNHTEFAAVREALAKYAPTLNAAIIQ